VEGEIAYLFIVVDQSTPSILRSQVKLINGQRSQDSVDQCNAMAVKQYANEGDSALQNSTPLKSSPLHMCVYLTVVLLILIGNAFAKHY
jgi:hypothetical protein